MLQAEALSSQTKNRAPIPILAKCAILSPHKNDRSSILRMHPATPAPVQQIYEQHPLRLISPSTIDWLYCIPDHSISTTHPSNPNPNPNSTPQTPQAYQSKEPPPGNKYTHHTPRSPYCCPHPNKMALSHPTSPHRYPKAKHDPQPKRVIANPQATGQTPPRTTARANIKKSSTVLKERGIFPIREINKRKHNKEAVIWRLENVIIEVK